MAPAPLSPSTVHIALQYIAPPSQLDQPLPPYLLSKPLLQRHHFLQIPPDDPAQYLCWPADTSAKAIDLLEALPLPVDDDSPQAYSVQYTSDPEHTYAHVALMPGEQDGVRLVFQWDEPDGWKFHDTKLMPFPQGSKALLSDVLATPVPNTITPQSNTVPSEYNMDPFGEQNESSDDDDYWNAYGANDSDDPVPQNALSASKDISGDSEDAYWARYSSVHGTADSTIPSPPIQRRRPNPYTEQNQDTTSPYPLPVPVRSDLPEPLDEILHIPQSLLNRSYPIGSRRSDPASPKDLARRLAELSPRHSPALISDFEHVDAPELELSPPLDGSDTSDTGTMSTDALGLITSAEASPIAQDRPHGISEAFGQVDVGDVDEEALRQSIKGVYALWKLSRLRKGPSSEQDDRSTFMKVVEDTIA